VKANLQAKMQDVLSEYLLQENMQKCLQKWQNVI